MEKREGRPKLDVMTRGQCLDDESGEMYASVLLLSKLNKLFFGYFDPGNIFIDEKINYFSG